MFQVARFGGFSNPPKNKDQAKINQLLSRLKTSQSSEDSDDAQAQAQAHAQAHAQVAGGGAVSKAEAHDQEGSGNDSDSGDSTGSSNSSSSENNGSDSDSKGDGSDGERGSDSDSEGESGESEGERADEEEGESPKASYPTAPTTLNQPVVGKTLEIARAMMAGNASRTNLLRKLSAPAAFGAGGDLAASKESGRQARDPKKRAEERAAAKKARAKAAAEAQRATWACLDPVLQEEARSKGLQSWFPIQTEALPTMVSALRAPGDKACGGDFCIAAPTGSGKTLAYVLPVLQALIHRRVMRLRALVILPTRDLALQVYGVFRSWAMRTGLKVGLIRGQAPFREEQAMLMGNTDASGGFIGGAGDFTVPSGTCRVDVLVATPGRLIDHLQQTPGFTLQHLRVLVIDEVDRLTRQSYQQWLSKVNAAVHAATEQKADHSMSGVSADLPTPPSAGAEHGGFSPVHTWGGDGAASHLGLLSIPVFTPHRPTVGVAWTPFTRILVSATLTTNPQKLEEMQLRRPTVFALEGSQAKPPRPAQASHKRKQSGGSDDNHAHGDGSDDEQSVDEDDDAASNKSKYVRVKNKMKKMFATPATLSEHMVICRTGAERPLALLHLLHERVLRDGLQVIVFCSSVESTHRLARLLEVYGGFPGEGVYEFSRNVSQNRRNEMIRGFRKKRCLVLVASDSMARGMDMVQCRVVINYDAPVYVKTYIHRAGRTARAGRAGDVFTILRSDQVRHFKQLLRRIDNSFVDTINLDFSASGKAGEEKTPDQDPGEDSHSAHGKRARLSKSTSTDFRPLVERFGTCLQLLRQVVLLEQSGRLRADAAVPADLVGKPQ